MSVLVVSGSALIRSLDLTSSDDVAASFVNCTLGQVVIPSGDEIVDRHCAAIVEFHSNVTGTLGVAIPYEEFGARPIVLAAGQPPGLFVAANRRLVRIGLRPTAIAYARTLETFIQGLWLLPEANCLVVCEGGAVIFGQNGQEIATHGSDLVVDWRVEGGNLVLVHDDSLPTIVPLDEASVVGRDH